MSDSRPSRVQWPWALPTPEEKERQIVFLKDFGRLWSSPKHSDLKIYLRLGDTGPSYIFHAHHNILSLRTSYFENATRHGFKEGLLNEVHLEEYDLLAMVRVLQYCYTGDYTILDGPMVPLLQTMDFVNLPSCSKPSTSNAGSQSVLNEKILGNIDPWPIKQIQVYILADMFLIHDLRSLAVKRFQSCLEGDQIIAEKYLEQVIRIIYSETASVQLRKFVAGFVQKRCKLPGMIAIIQKPSFQSLMRETEFGADLAQSFISDAFSGA